MKENHIKKILLRLVFLMIIAGYIAFGSLESLKPVKQWLQSETILFKIGTHQITAYTIIYTLVTVVALFWGAGYISKFLEKRIKNLKTISPSNKALFTKGLQIAIYCIVGLFGLDILGIDLTTLAIFSGAIGIGIGFGLQKITSNFISGIILLFEKSIKVDDLVEINDGTFGFVRHTGSRYTRIEAIDGKEILIPNEDFITNRVVNWTYSNTKARVDVPMGIAYGSDVDKAMEIMLLCAKQHPRCVLDPNPVCYVTECADFSINLLLFFWISNVNESRLEPKSDVLRDILKKFTENDIVIPFPQSEIRVKNMYQIKS